MDGNVVVLAQCYANGSQWLKMTIMFIDWAVLITHHVLTSESCQLEYKQSDSRFMFEVDSF